MDEAEVQALKERAEAAEAAIAAMATQLDEERNLVAQAREQIATERKERASEVWVLRRDFAAASERAIAAERLAEARAADRAPEIVSAPPRVLSSNVLGPGVHISEGLFLRR